MNNVAYFFTVFWVAYGVAAFALSMWDLWLNRQVTGNSVDSVAAPWGTEVVPPWGEGFEETVDNLTDGAFFPAVDRQVTRK